MALNITLSATYNKEIMKIKTCPKCCCSDKKLSHDFLLGIEINAFYECDKCRMSWSIGKPIKRKRNHEFSKN